VKIESKNIRVEFNARLYSHLIAKFDGKETVLGAFEPSESVTADGKELQDFTLSDTAVEKAVVVTWFWRRFRCIDGGVTNT